jgi:hypothetical protein
MDPKRRPHLAPAGTRVLLFIAIGAIGVSCAQYTILSRDSGAGGESTLGGSGGALGDASPHEVPVDTGPSDVGQDGPSSADTGSEVGCVARGAEDCFNGLDDDCNGHSDCDDPACSPVSACVPSAPGFDMGTVVAPSAICPFRYSNPAVILGKDLDSSGVCTGCSCALQSMTCSLQLFNTGSGCDQASLLGTYSATLDVSTSTVASPCSAAAIAANEGWRTGALSATGVCSGQGTPTLSRAAAFLTQTTFCGTQLLGNGCPGGNVCVPVKTSRNCIRAVGSASCPSGYSPEGVIGGWYTGIADQRTCGVTCSCGPSQGGVCGPMTRLLLNPSTCGVLGSYGLPQNDSFCPSTSPKSTVVTGSISFDTFSAIRPTCGQPTNQIIGSVSPMGPQTLCCSN